jgi:uncharacterized membrane protein YedE/YeeE
MSSATPRPLFWALVYVAVGVFFGFALIKGEMASWYRIQEMFRFQSFHMYGLMFSAVGISALVVAALRRSRTRSLAGTPLEIAGKPFGSGVRYGCGGFVFGLGWGLGGVCPGPIYALLGSFVPGAVVVFVAALAGTYAYARLAPRLPH